VMGAFEASLPTFPKKLFAGLQAVMMAKSYPITNPTSFMPLTHPQALNPTI
jgi:hypothetical protein